MLDETRIDEERNEVGRSAQIVVCKYVMITCLLSNVFESNRLFRRVARSLSFRCFDLLEINFSFS